MQRALTAVLVLALVGAAVYFGIQLTGGDSGGQHKPQPHSVTAPDPVTATKPTVDRAVPTPDVPGPVAAQPPKDVIEGTIKDEYNQPVPEVSVQIIRYDFVRDSNRPPDRSWREEVVEYTVSDDKGAYSLKKLRIGDTLVLRAAKPGFISSIKDRVPVGAHVDFTLLAGTPVNGQVVDADSGKPVKDVNIKGWFQTPESNKDLNATFRWKEEVLTDANGKFQFEGVPAKLVKFMLYHPDYDDVVEDHTIVQGSQNVVNFKVHLGLVVEGEVLDALKQTPVPDITVRAQDTLVPRWVSKTDAKGRFRLTGVKAAPIRFSLTGKRYTTLNEVKTLTGDDRFDPAKDGPRIQFKIQPAGRAAGVITNSMGAPVANAKVFVAENRTLFYPVRNPAEAVTGADGTFLVDDLGAGVKYKLAAVADGMAVNVSDEFTVGPAEIKEGLSVKLPRGAIIRGTVVDENHAPVANTLVDIEVPQYVPVWFAKELDVGQPGHRTITTGPDGTFKVDLLWPGQYAVRVDNPEYVLVDKVTLTIKDLEEELVHDFTLQRAFSITGRVLGKDGMPSEGASILAWWFERNEQPISATTDKNGDYRLLRLNKGPYRVKAEKAAESLTSLPRDDVQAGSTAVDFQLVGHGMVVGAVVAPNGSPVQDFNVLLHPLSAGGGQRPNRKGGTGGLTAGYSNTEEQYHDPGGIFRIQNVDPGTYSLEIVATEFAPSTPVELRVDGSATTDVGTIPLRSGATIFGAIRGPQGEPIPDMEVKVQLVGSDVKGVPAGAGGRTLWSARTSTSGEYRVAGLPPGDYLLQFESTGYVDPASVRLTLADGQQLQHNETVRPAASISLVVKDDLGEPVPSVIPRVFDSQQRPVPVNPTRPGGGNTDIQGRLEISKVPAGEQIKITLVRAGYEVKDEMFELRPGEKASREVRIVKSR